MCIWNRTKDYIMRFIGMLTLFTYDSTNLSLYEKVIMS